MSMLSVNNFNYKVKIETSLSLTYSKIHLTSQLSNLISKFNRLITYDDRYAVYVSIKPIKFTKQNRISFPIKEVSSCFYFVCNWYIIRCSNYSKKLYSRAYFTPWRVQYTQEIITFDSCDANCFSHELIIPLCSELTKNQVGVHCNYHYFYR